MNFPNFYSERTFHEHTHRRVIHQICSADFRLKTGHNYELQSWTSPFRKLSILFMELLKCLLQVATIGLHILQPFIPIYCLLNGTQSNLQRTHLLFLGWPSFGNTRSWTCERLFLEEMAFVLVSGAGIWTLRLFLLEVSFWKLSHCPINCSISNFLNSFWVIFL